MVDRGVDQSSCSAEIPSVYCPCKSERSTDVYEKGPVRRGRPKDLSDNTRCHEERLRRKCEWESLMAHGAESANTSCVKHFASAEHECRLNPNYRNRITFLIEVDHARVSCIRVYFLYPTGLWESARSSVLAYLR